MSIVWGMIRQRGSNIKVSIELLVAARHRRDMTEKLLKAILNQNKETIKHGNGTIKRQATSPHVSKLRKKKTVKYKVL